MRIIIVGSGFAGLSAYIRLRDAGFDPVIITSGKYRGSSWKAQGGIAVPLGEDDVEAHVHDTLTAGRGLCDEGVVRYVVRSGLSMLDWIRSLGFQPGCERSLEAGHSKARVVRGRAADDIGAELMSVLDDKVKDQEVARACHLEVEDGKVVGLHTDKGYYDADVVIMATGGYAGLYEFSTNDSEGEGLAIAMEAGALARDLEFVQFHPTVTFIGGEGHLLTEALRGEGAVLVNEKGEAFMKKYDARGELAPRDVVAKAIYMELSEGRKVYLDLSKVRELSSKFPNVVGYLSKFIDPGKDPVPVSPAAHFTMGGVSTDALGRSSVKGLFVIGEAGNAMMHGANRLASNSILQALVQGYGLPSAVKRYQDGMWLDGQIGFAFPRQDDKLIYAPPLTKKDSSSTLCKKIMWQDVGIVRSETALKRAVEGLEGLGRIIAMSALARQDSVGAHQRLDFPLPPPRPYHVYVKALDHDRGQALCL